MMQMAWLVASLFLLAISASYLVASCWRRRRRRKGVWEAEKESRGEGDGEVEMEAVTRACAPYEQRQQFLPNAWRKKLLPLPSIPLSLLSPPGGGGGEKPLPPLPEKRQNSSEPETELGHVLSQLDPGSANAPALLRVPGAARLKDSRERAGIVGTGTRTGTGAGGEIWARPVSSIYTEYRTSRVIPFGGGGGSKGGSGPGIWVRNGDDGGKEEDDGGGSVYEGSVFRDVFRDF